MERLTAVQNFLAESASAERFSDLPDNFFGRKVAAEFYLPGRAKTATDSTADLYRNTDHVLYTAVDQLQSNRFDELIVAKSENKFFRPRTKGPCHGSERIVRQPAESAIYLHPLLPLDNRPKVAEGRKGAGDEFNDTIHGGFAQPGNLSVIRNDENVSFPVSFPQLPDYFHTFGDKGCLVGENHVRLETAVRSRFPEIVFASDLLDFVAFPLEESSQIRGTPASRRDNYAFLRSPSSSHGYSGARSLGSGNHQPTLNLRNLPNHPLKIVGQIT
jgi:hypothetical protein